MLTTLNGHTGVVYVLLSIMTSCKGISVAVPEAGNCGEDTEIICQYNGTLAQWGWLVLGEGILMYKGQLISPENDGKYEEKYGDNSFSLIIKNTQISDAKEYRCSIGFTTSSIKKLNFECKAKSATAHIGKDKKLTFIVDELYPNPSSILVAIVPKVTGSLSCVASSQHPDYWRCLWTSSQALSTGNYNYTVIVTTLTQAEPITGAFKIVSPNQPAFLNTDVISYDKDVIWGIDGTSLVIQCVSRGGFPEPTVALYSGTVAQENILVTDSTTKKEEDNTYTITLARLFIVTKQNDKQTYICRSSYPQTITGYQDPKQTTVFLYLESKPSSPTSFSYIGSLAAPSFYWEGSFLGGIEQSFVIEVSQVGSSEWMAKLVINETDKAHVLPNAAYIADITGLGTGSFMARIMARNRFGRSDYLMLISSFSSVAVPQSPEYNQPVSTAAIVAGIAAGVFIIVVGAVVVVIVIKRMQMPRRAADKGDTKGGSEIQMQEGTSSGEQLNDMIPDADHDYAEDTTARNVYEQLDSNRLPDRLYETMSPASEKDKIDAKQEYVNLTV